MLKAVGRPEWVREEGGWGFVCVQQFTVAYCSEYVCMCVCCAGLDYKRTPMQG